MPGTTRLLLAAATVLPLSACASFPLFHSAHAESTSLVARSDVSPNTYTDLGRQQLDKGQIGAAIDSFRVAVAMGENPAAAINGLGVAYTRLGRNDAAATLFTKAALLDPTNDRYARNLARVDASRHAAVLAQSDDAALPTAPAIPAAVPQRRPGQFSRVSGQEVRVSAAPQTSSRAALAVVESRSPRVVRASSNANPAEPHLTAAHAAPAKIPAAVDPRFRPLMRVALRPAAAQAHPTLRSTAFTLASKPKAPIDNRFVPLVRVQFADASPTKSNRKVVVIAER